MTACSHCRKYRKGQHQPIAVARLVPVRDDDPSRQPGERCPDCLLNQLCYWPDQWVVTALPEHEQEVQQYQEQATAWRRGGPLPEAVDIAYTSASTTADRGTQEDNSMARKSKTTQHTATATKEAPKRRMVNKSAKWPAGTRVTARFKGKNYEGLVGEENGKPTFTITKPKRYSRKVYGSPSSAGAAIANHPINGYVFWTPVDADDDPTEAHTDSDGAPESA